MSQTILQTHDLSVSFGPLLAVDSVNLVLPKGGRHALIGPNGAGKTTLINLLTGALRPTAGTVHLDGQNITPLSMSKRARRGLVRTFQINSLFPELTAFSSVVMCIGERDGLGGRWWRALRHQTAVFDEAAGWLDYLGLAAVADKPVRHLPYGQQRLLEMALALACRPRVLLLDEPAAGLPGGEGGAVLDAVDALPDDLCVLLIEHDMNIVFQFAHTVSVLAQGRVLMTGTPDQVRHDDRVRSIYLGDP